MILQALADYYTRLQHDPNTDIAPIGFSRQQISFEVVLEEDGTLHDILDARRQEGKKLVPRSLIVPGGAKSSGAGFNPGFLWDNTGYLFGHKPEDAKPERTQKSFEAFRDRHLALKEEIDDPDFSAVCRFLKHWNPANAESHEILKEITTGFGLFRIRGRDHYVHERDAVLNYWQQQLHAHENNDDEPTGQCLVTGRIGPLARLHKPKIKGVRGAQSSGAPMVSFNFKATESYGKESGMNAPVGSHTAFEYCTALNSLLRSGSRQRVQIGDATTVFWTEQPTKAETFMGYVFDTESANDDATKSRLDALLKTIAHGSYPADIGEPTTPFYVLGLSPNAARISIRFWHVSTLKDVIDKLKQHFNDLSLERTSFDHGPEFPAIWHLLRETARESKDIPPLLAGGLMRAILTGVPYPEALYAAILRRIRADRLIRGIRIAVLKACLNRNSRCHIHPLKKEISMSLDPDRPEPAYHMGRLFAALEKAQEDALPGINATIKDRYFSAASATPASVFPRLIRLSQHHLAKLDLGKKIHREKNIQEICGRIDQFPSHLGLQNQGLFVIGYYHQRQNFFTKKQTTPDTPNEE